MHGTAALVVPICTSSENFLNYQLIFFYEFYNFSVCVCGCGLSISDGVGRYAITSLDNRLDVTMLSPLHGLSLNLNETYFFLVAILIFNSFWLQVFLVAILMAVRC